jgi:hypothetical protein
MSIPGADYRRTLLNASEPPAISIYQPTHRMHPDNEQDPIRFKNLVKQVEESIIKAYPVRDRRAFMEPLLKLQDDADFWNHTLDGLAVFASSNRFDVFCVGKVGRAVPELAIVAETFHTKPLIRYLQSSDRFEVLAIGRDNVAVFEGNRYALDPVDARHVPSQFLEGPARPRTQTHPDADTERFFRAVDKAVIEHVSVPSGVPLVLAALSENLTAFRAVTKNPQLIPDDLAVDPFALSPEELRARAWKVLEPHYLARIAKISEDFGLAQSRQQGTGDLSDAAKAAVAGKIATLMVDADQVHPGKIDATGAIESADLAKPCVDDKLDDLAELVLKMGGDVVIVPSDRMPTKTGLAAIYRF